MARISVEAANFFENVRAGNRRILSGIMYALKVGCRWQDLRQNTAARTTTGSTSDSCFNTMTGRASTHAPGVAPRRLNCVP
jgi:transposase